ncbi:MAG: peptidyl-prolyl cis-trans isomerase (rotamase) - cyclophilin family [Flavipsychrobacter sp.]|nr:peptidyl-prolyl cis-trans isomerase (rotamase) - cyclophilin family [Flavipsychrobacter sp.]
MLSIIACCRVGAQTETTFYTSMGSFTVALTDTITPITTDSFIVRVNNKFYDGLIFHRVIKNFMIQGGDPLGNGTGGPGYMTPDEFSPKLKNVPGALAMANSGPNTNGSQFYINLVNNAYLNNHYTVFGMVTTNFAVVQSIGLVATDTTDKPLTEVVIDSIRIMKPAPSVVSNINDNAAPAIYPNPTGGVFTIDIEHVATKVEVLNIPGRVLYTTEATGPLQVDLRDQRAGLYIVRLTSVNGRSETKLVVQ